MIRADISAFEKSGEVRGAVVSEAVVVLPTCQISKERLALNCAGKLSV